MITAGKDGFVVENRQVGEIAFRLNGSERFPFGRVSRFLSFPIVERFFKLFAPTKRQWVAGVGESTDVKSEPTDRVFVTMILLKLDRPTSASGHADGALELKDDVTVLVFLTRDANRPAGAGLTIDDLIGGKARLPFG